MSSPICLHLLLNLTSSFWYATSICALIPLTEFHTRHFIWCNMLIVAHNGGHILVGCFTLGSSLDSLCMPYLLFHHKCIIFATVLQPVSFSKRRIIKSRLFNENTVATFLTLLLRVNLDVYIFESQRFTSLI